MKKVKMFALMLLAGAAIFSSCKKDEETGPAPTITFTNNVSSYEIDFATQPNPYTVTFTVTIAAEEEINAFTAKMKEGTTTTSITPAPTGFSGKTSFSYNYSGNFTPTMTYPIELTFSVTDKADQTTTKTFTVTKKAAATGTPMGAFSNYTTILMGAQSATEGSFYASSSNTVYGIADAKTNSGIVDFCYYYGATNLASLAAPANTDAQSIYNGPTSGIQTWTTKNSTLFVLANTFDFTNLTTTTDISGITFGTATDATSLTPGNIVAFKTAANKIGFAKVTACANSNTGTITLDVKVQN